MLSAASRTLRNCFCVWGLPVSSDRSSMYLGNAVNRLSVAKIGQIVPFVLPGDLLLLAGARLRLGVGCRPTRRASLDNVVRGRHAKQTR